MNTLLITVIYKQGGGRLASEYIVNSHNYNKIVYLKYDGFFKIFSSLFNTLKDVIFNKYDLIILDGLIPSFLSFFIYKKKFWVINHNIEFLRYSGLKKYIIFFSQNHANLNSSKSFFFSELDKSYYNFKKSSVIWPFKKKNIKEVNIDKYKNYKYLIPSNFNYPPNIEGLIIYYKKFRQKFKGNIIISNPVRKYKIPSSLRKFISDNNDKIISLNYDCYLMLMSKKEIILPIFSGSGIQIKAMEAYSYSKKVYSSNFIINSSSKFSKFSSLENENKLKKYEDYF